MSASMAEVLAKHQWMAASPDPAERCTCGIYPAAQTNKAMAAHQAEQLAANGYGKLEDAWDEGLSAGCDRWMDAREFGDPPVNPYRRPE